MAARFSRGSTKKRGLGGGDMTSTWCHWKGFNVVGRQLTRNCGKSIVLWLWRWLIVNGSSEGSLSSPRRVVGGVVEGPMSTSYPMSNEVLWNTSRNEKKNKKKNRNEHVGRQLLHCLRRYSPKSPALKNCFHRINHWKLRFWLLRTTWLCCTNLTLSPLLFLKVS